MVIVMLSVALVAGSAGPVRSSSPTIAALVDRGAARSPTLSAVLDALGRYPVITYLQPTAHVREGLVGATRHDVVAVGLLRYIHIAINPKQRPERLLAVIAHELQHALEIARDLDATSADAVDRLFERIGFRCPGQCYETEAARDIERRVAAELSSHGTP